MIAELERDGKRRIGVSESAVVSRASVRQSRENADILFEYNTAPAGNKHRLGLHFKSADCYRPTAFTAAPPFCDSTLTVKFDPLDTIHRTCTELFPGMLFTRRFAGSRRCSTA